MTSGTCVRVVAMWPIGTSRLIETLHFGTHVTRRQLAAVFHHFDFLIQTLSTIEPKKSDTDQNIDALKELRAKIENGMNPLPTSFD
jgi:hypothetical protein